MKGWILDYSNLHLVETANFHLDFDSNKIMDQIVVTEEERIQRENNVFGLDSTQHALNTTKILFDRCSNVTEGTDTRPTTQSQICRLHTTNYYEYTMPRGAVRYKYLAHLQLQIWTRFFGLHIQDSN